MLRIEVVSDVVCPWCFVGKRRLEQALALVGRGRPDGLDVRIAWKPFELNPSLPKDGIDRETYRRTKFGSLKHSQLLDARLLAVGESVGIPFAFDKIHRTPNTFDAHRLLWLAETVGRQDQLAEALFRGYFLEGLDVGDHAVLTDLAERSGIPSAATTSLLEGRQGEAEVRSEENRAYQSGIHAVPHFLVEGAPGISGAQAPEIIAAAIKSGLTTLGREAGHGASISPPAGQPDHTADDK
jgi:predicted DsbA family dithiol-disulfide isomerase